MAASYLPAALLDDEDGNISSASSGVDDQGTLPPMDLDTAPTQPKGPGLVGEEDLRAALLEREVEINRLKRLVGEEAGTMDVRDAKLRELVRKNRGLVQALGKERATVAALQASTAAASKAPRNPLPDPPPDQAASAASDLRAQLSAAQARAHDYRQEAQKLKAELTKYQRALAREVGDNVPLAKVVDGQGGWRGRAQQIALLKARLREAQGGEHPGEGGRARGGDPAEERARKALAAREQEKKGRLAEALVKEQALEAKCVDYAGKVEALTARIKTLEHTQKSLKEKLQLLLTKSDGDDELIAALKSQLADGTVAAKGDATDVDGLRQQVDRQEQIIISLQGEVDRLGGAEGMVTTLRTENDKLRELCSLLRAKVAGD